MVSTTGGRRPSRPRACRSGRVNAVPLFSAGVSRRTRPRTCGRSLVNGEEDAVAKRTSKKNSGHLQTANGRGLSSGNRIGSRASLSQSARVREKAGKNPLSVTVVTRKNRGPKIKFKEFAKVAE